jgi:hypothetical protein
MQLSEVFPLNTLVFVCRFRYGALGRPESVNQQPVKTAEARAGDCEFVVTMSPGPGRERLIALLTSLKSKSLV